MTPDQEEQLKRYQEFLVEGQKYFYDKQLLKELEEFSEKREREMFKMKPLEYGTMGEDLAKGCPYDMEPSDYKQRKIEKMIETFKEAGVVFIDQKRPDTPVYIPAEDPWERDFELQQHYLTSTGVLVRNPYTTGDFKIETGQA